MDIVKKDLVLCSVHLSVDTIQCSSFYLFIIVPIAIAAWCFDGDSSLCFQHYSKQW